MRPRFSEKDAKNSLWRIIETKVSELRKEAINFSKKIRLPESINAFEYSDGLLGAALIKSGSEVSADLNVVLIRAKTKEN